MKNLLKICLVVAFVFLCTGCDGTVTRDIRHAGFSVGNKFECGKFYAKDKNDNYYIKIRYFTGSHVIDEDGEIYEVSLSQNYSNGENCIKAQTIVHVDAIFDNKIVKGIDGKYYYLAPQNDLPSYSPIPTTDNSYTVYDILLKDKDVVKVVTADSSKGLYYVLKRDGNVYGYTISSQSHNTPARLSSITIIYAKEDYGGDIIDFNYAGDSLATFVRTDKQLYRMMINNTKECSKYADIPCDFSMREDTVLEKYASRIIAYNGSVLITDYKTIFSVTA